MHDQKHGSGAGPNHGMGHERDMGHEHRDNHIGMMIGHDCMHGAGAGSCEDRFGRFDADHDGAITEAEFSTFAHRHAGASGVFAARDANNDGNLTKDELCAVAKGKARTDPQ